MSLNDPIADFLTRIRNATAARHKYVDVQLSKMNQAILTLLQEEGFIERFLLSQERRLIRVMLKYGKNRMPVLHGLRRISRPGVRKYVNAKHAPSVMGGLGMSILSTPKGVISDAKARSENVGGELLACVW